MKKSTLSTIITLAVIGIIIAWGVGRYNAFVTMQENVDNAWGQVENQYQRRLDLIPNLVQTVKEAGIREQENLVGAIEARAKATQMNINADNLTDENLAAFQKAQGELGQALNRLMVVVEQYPELKTNQNFLTLMDQLEGTENRITYARNLFNDSAKEYNAGIRRFPASIIASLAGFERKPYFKAEEGAEKAPSVDFGR
ncbi:MAG: LemA family protein [Paludibacteraceae bacterium]|nr:LemA family protein [Paludibacteraceae bacterium]